MNLYAAPDDATGESVAFIHRFVPLCLCASVCRRHVYALESVNVVESS
jgi:hypothetical protein